eukprot:709831-Prymnesium_polylepis.1
MAPFRSARKLDSARARARRLPLTPTPARSAVQLDIKPDLGISHSKIANVCPKKLKKVLDAVFGEKFLTTGDPMSEGGLIVRPPPPAKARP